MTHLTADEQIAAAVTDERERCARIAEACCAQSTFVTSLDRDQDERVNHLQGERFAARQIARAIRRQSVESKDR